MPQSISSIWVYLSASPLLWLTATLWAYLGAHWLHERSGRNPLVNSVTIAVIVLIVVLLATDTKYDTYFQGAQFVHFLLGPATVALAVPLYNNLAAVRRMFLPMMAALVAGSATAIASGVGIAWLAGADLVTLKSLASKSVTTPIAMAVTEQIGGLPSLTAVFVILTGIVGAILVTPLFNALGIHDKQARGFAVGLAAHGIGTARAFQVSDVSGAFAGIAMALNGVITAVLVPVLARVF
ncbi:MAG: LrgB family protein [Steroidobacteraceae bacterium]|jgi:predicted murein hydrolase (TIGR00659 family)